MSKAQMRQAYGKELKALDNLAKVYIDSYLSGTSYFRDANELIMTKNIFDRRCAIFDSLVDCGEEWGNVYTYVNSFPYLKRLINKGGN